MRFQVRPLSSQSGRADWPARPSGKAEAVGSEHAQSGRADCSAPLNTVSFNSCFQSSVTQPAALVGSKLHIEKSVVKVS